MKIKIKCIAVAMLIFISLGLTACGRSSLVGTWENSNRRLEFFSDGSVSQSYHISGRWDLSAHGTWVTDGNRLSLTGVRVGGPFTFSISGDTLTVEDDNGMTIVWNRVR